MKRESRRRLIVGNLTTFACVWIFCNRMFWNQLIWVQARRLKRCSVRIKNHKNERFSYRLSRACKHWGKGCRRRNPCREVVCLLPCIHLTLDTQVSCRRRFHEKGISFILLLTKQIYLFLFKTVHFSRLLFCWTSHGNHINNFKVA